MASIREIKEGKQYQGLDERFNYRLATTNWASSPDSASVVVKKRNIETGEFTDVTATVLPSGSVLISGDQITLPTFVPIAKGDEYKVEVKFTVGATTYEPFAWVIIEL
jgi:hypothetical protein